MQHLQKDEDGDSKVERVKELQIPGLKNQNY